MKSDTIAAPATALSSAGIGIIRISGDDAIEIADRIFCAKNKKKLTDCASHTIHYGYVSDGNRMIDEVLVMLMKAPNSYTREDIVEIDCHGGMLIMQKILEAVIHSGARMAEPGEFTKRAFLNGRIDLAQAESVIDMINAKNDFAWQSSIDQLSGSLSKKIRQLREKIINETAFIESALDDPEHISMEGYGQKLHPIVKKIISEIDEILSVSENGELLKEGIRTVIIGKPNAGKSSLMNVLVGRERAIVTDTPGTTRDALEERINLDGILLHVVDTAGIRETKDRIEQIGVEKAKEYLQQSDLIIYVVDSSVQLDKDDEEIFQLLQNRKVLILLNKSDLTQAVSEEMLREKLSEQKFHYQIISVSAKQETGIAELKNAIQEMFFSGEISCNGEIMITNVRQKAALQSALESMKLVERSIENQMPEDFYSIDLMNAYERLGKITGETVEEDLVNEIFSKFCMGK